jgi:hypothetical protein
VILAAGLCVLLGLGLFVGGILTGVTAFYWGCVAVCVVAAVLLFLARRTLTRSSRPADAPTAVGAPATTTTPSAPAHAVVPPPTTTPSGAVEPDARPAGATASSVAGSTPAEERADPPVEEVEVTDLLMVVDLTDEVLVIDEHPRYHLPGCRFVAGRTTIPLPLHEARADGFTPCAACAPDRTLAQRARDAKRAG